MAKTPTLSSLKLEFDIDRAEALAPVEELDRLYREQLDKLRLAAQGRGKLEEVIAVEAEITKLDGKPLPEGGSDFPELVKVREIYSRAHSERQTAMNRTLESLVARQRTALEALRTSQTQANQLDEALLTHKEIEKIEALEEEIGRRGKGERPRSLAVAAPGLGGEGGGVQSLTLRVQVDGLSHLHLRGAEIWYDHTKGRAAPPGRHQGTFPTYLNDKTAWLPRWEGNSTERHQAPISLALEGEGTRIRLRHSSGRGNAEVIQQPGPENDYTAIVELRDATREGRAFFGSDWLEFRLSW